MGKFYVGRGKQETNRFGNEEYKMNICLEDIPEQAKFKASNGKTYVYIDLVPLKAVDDKGNTHTVSGWHKDDQQAQPQQQAQSQAYNQVQQQQAAQQGAPPPTPEPSIPNFEVDDSDIPF